MIPSLFQATDREQPSAKKGKRIHFWWGDGVASQTMERRASRPSTRVPAAGKVAGRGRRLSPLATYFCVGAGFCGAAGGAEGVVGVAGCDFVCAGFAPESTDVDPVLRAAKIESVIDVTMKMIADQVVARERTEAAPRGPNAVWLP